MKRSYFGWIMFTQYVDFCWMAWMCIVMCMSNNADLIFCQTLYACAYSFWFANTAVKTWKQAKGSGKCIWRHCVISFWLILSYCGCIDMNALHLSAYSRAPDFPAGRRYFRGGSGQWEGMKVLSGKRHKELSRSQINVCLSQHFVTYSAGQAGAI